MPGIASLEGRVLQGIDRLADCKLPGIDSIANFKLQMILGYSSDKYLGIFFVGKSKDLCILHTKKYLFLNVSIFKKSATLYKS